MKTVKISELSKVKMSVNPPQCVVDADFRVIHDGKIKRYVGIGWVEEAPATPKDYEIIPKVID